MAGEEEMSTRLARHALIAAVALSATLLTGCASAPVQEMSNARQAIRAAQDAGAARSAAETLNQAQTALTKAEALLNKHLYRAARHSAEEAHTKALSALDQARGAGGR